MKQFETVLKAKDGLGFGEGGISHADRLSKVSDLELMNRVEGLIASDEILIAVDTDSDGNQLDDDGCGDGRGVKRVFKGMIEKAKSLHRPKVFGGSLVQVAAGLIANGHAHGVELQGLMSSTLVHLKVNKINFGAHTDDHAHGEACGCGAIDKFNVAVANAVKYEDAIRQTITALGVSGDGLGEVFSEYQAYHVDTKDQTVSGKKVVNSIMANNKVVKELTDEHREAFIILNMVPDMTVNQSKVREVSNDEIQVFGVDVWRMQQLAEQAFINPTEQKMAFLGMLVQTLGTAATLTKGDLPVYVISGERQLVAA